MPLTGLVGFAQALDPREAGSMASLKALEQVGRNPIGLGFVIASHSLPLAQVLGGASALLGDTPLFGFSASAELSESGISQHSVLVALLTGNDLIARADWFPGLGEDGRGIGQKIAQNLVTNPANSAGYTLLLAADAFNGDFKELSAVLPNGDYAIAGCLAGGELRQGRTYQLGGRQTGHSGVAAAYLGSSNGKLVTGVGVSHGWKPVGMYFDVSRAQGNLLHSLNEKSCAEIYSQAFGYPVHDWSIPPLNELVRLYPLGLDQGKGRPMLVRSPLRMEVDGSLHLHTLVSESSSVHMLVGSTENCLKAAETATATALKALNGARPLLALVLVDTAWQVLMETRAGSEMQAVRGILGPDVPIAGGYTYGQIARSGCDATEGGASLGRPELFNQAIEVILFGEASE